MDYGQTEENVGTSHFTVLHVTTMLDSLGSGHASIRKSRKLNQVQFQGPMRELVYLQYSDIEI